MIRSLFALVAALSIAIAVGACGGDVATSPIVPLDPDADGATIYQARCASCHGEDLGGTEKGPSQLSIVYEPNHHGDDSYRSAIRNGASQHHWGFGDMPAIQNVSDAQIESVISYIRGEQDRLGFEG